MSFKYLGKNCPICTGARKDCRQSTATGLVHCRDADANPLGFSLIGVDSLGFGMWGDTLQLAAASEEQREQWRREREADRHRRAKEKQERCAGGLFEAERDAEIRKVLDQLDLKPTHRADLRRRGLTDEQIEAGQFRSVEKWQRLQVPVSVKLAGVAPDGGALLTQAGYLCPIRNFEGLLTGWQLRADNPDDGGKYRWPTSRTRRNPEGVTAHLQNGELPVQHARPNGHDKLAGPPGIIEGTLKPWIAAQLSRQIMLGAAGGLFGKEQLVAGLERACAEWGDRTVILYPDAGGVSNQQVFRRDADTVKFLQSQGFCVKVANWGQLRDKNAPDFDELLAAGRGEHISLLSAETFVGLSQEPSQKEWIIDRDRREWNRLSQLTSEAGDRICRQFLGFAPADILNPGIYCIQSPMGSGKTEALKLLTQTFPAGNVLSYRNSLCKDAASRVPALEFLHDLRGVTGEGAATDALYLKYGVGWLIGCVNSIRRFGVRPVVIFEEAAKVFPHLIAGATCRRQRSALLAEVKRHVEAATHIFLFDADLTDSEVALVAAMNPALPVRKVVNDFKANSYPVFWHLGTEGRDGIAPNNPSALLKRVLDAPVNGPFVVVSDSQVLLETLEKQLASNYPELAAQGLRVDSFTSTVDPRVEAFLAQPNEYIRNNLPGWLLLSPTAEASLNIVEPHFGEVFGLFYGVISAFAARQMLGRYRPPVPRHVWSRERAGGEWGRRQSKQVKTDLARRTFTTLGEIALGDWLEAGGEVENPQDLLPVLAELGNPSSELWRKNAYLNYYCDSEARDNFQRGNLREALRELLERAGHRIVAEVADIPQETGYKEVREEILRDRCQKIAEGREMPMEEAREILTDLGATPEERFAAEKALLKHRLPGLELSAERIYTFKYEQRQLLGNLETLWMSRHPELQTHFDRRRWAGALKHGQPAWDVRAGSLKLRKLEDLGVIHLAERRDEFDKNDPQILEIHRKALAQRESVRLATGVDISAESSPVYAVQRLLSKLGHDLKSRQPRREDGSRTRTYSVVRAEENELAREILEAYDFRWKRELEKLSAFQEERNTLHVLNSSPLETKSVPAAETPTEPAVEVLKSWRGVVCRLRDRLEEEVDGFWSDILANARGKIAGAVAKIDSLAPHWWCEALGWAVHVDAGAGVVSVPVTWLDFLV